jgi:ADP-heptose:LPS heptosyltransferase
MSNETEIPDLKGKKILMIRLSSLGDILLATPLVRALKAKFQAGSIDFVVKEQYRDTLKFNPHISNLYLKGIR